MITMSSVSDEGKRVSNLIINGAVIGLNAISTSKVASMVFPKALPTPRLAFALYDLAMDIIYLSIGRYISFSNLKAFFL